MRESFTLFLEFRDPLSAFVDDVVLSLELNHQWPFKPCSIEHRSKFCLGPFSADVGAFGFMVTTPLSISIYESLLPSGCNHKSVRVSGAQSRRWNSFLLEPSDGGNAKKSGGSRICFSNFQCSGQAMMTPTGGTSPHDEGFLHRGP